MEPKTRWIIGGVVAVIAAFGYIYLKNKQVAAANAQSPVLVSSGAPADLSTTSNIPETGFNAGDYTGSGYNGLGAAGVPLAGSNTFTNLPNTTVGETPATPMQPGGSLTQQPPPKTPPIIIKTPTPVHKITTGGGTTGLKEVA